MLECLRVCMCARVCACASLCCGLTIFLFSQYSSIYLTCSVTLSIKGLLTFELCLDNTVCILEMKHENKKNLAKLNFPRSYKKQPINQICLICPSPSLLVQPLLISFFKVKQKLVERVMRFDMF